VTSSSELRFDGDVAIVSGAGRGLGRAYAMHLASRGAQVVVNDIDQEAAQAVCDEITAAGGQVHADSHPIGDAEGSRAIVKTALDAFGKVTILVNNAGIISYASFAELTDDQWDSMKTVNLDGTYYLCKAVWPIFQEQKYGRIVNTTSNGGYAGYPTLAHYGTVKAAILGLTKVLAHEGAEHGIVVNAIAPMAVTRMNAEQVYGNAEPQEETWQQDIADGKVPMGPASVVAPAVTWLTHRDTDVTGEVFSVSSGKVGRVAIVVGDGFFDPDLEPEALRDHEQRVRSIESYFEPIQTADELKLIPPLFQR